MASSNITLSAGVRSNLLSLQNTADLMGRTQNRLATGKKVNTALDNPTNFFTSASLQSRAGEMSALLDNMSSGIKTLEAADNGITAINKTIESMQSTLRQARQDKSYKTGAFTFASDFDVSAQQTMSFSGGLVGDTPVNINLVTLGTAVQAEVGGTTNAAGYTAPVAGSNDGTASEVTGGAYTAIDLSDDVADTFSFDVTLGATTETITLSRSGAGADNIYSIAEATTEINAQLTAAGLGVTVSNDGTNLTFTADDNGAVALTVDGGVVSAANAALTDLGIANLGAAGQTDTGTDDTTPATSYSFTANGTAITLNSTNAATLTAARDAINTQLAADNNTEVTASIDADGYLTISGQADGSTNVTLVGADATTLFGATLTATGTAGTESTLKTVDALVSEINSSTALSGKIRASNDSGKLRIENLSTQALTVTSSSADVTDDLGTANQIGGNTVRANLIDQFNALRDQLNKLADDASFNGVNLLRGDKLKLTFNETGTSTMEIQAKNETGAERPINAATLDIDFALDGDFDVDADIDSRLDTLQTALGTLRSQASAFGSNLSIVQNRTEFTKNMVNTLQTGADALVLADTNEEAANMLALQTRQQLSSTALSLASQADQAVLRLF
jgi:flagellin